MNANGQPFALCCVVAATLIMVLSGGCGRHPDSQKRAQHPSSRLERFSMEEITGQFSLCVVGESAEVSPDRQSQTVRAPVLSLNTETETIEVTTGAAGQAEVRLDPVTHRIASVLLEGGVRVIQKDRTSGAVVMEATCRKMTYRADEQVLIMEGNPVVRRQGGTFSGEKVLYHVDENRLEIKGNVNVGIPVEKPRTPRP